MNSREWFTSRALAGLPGLPNTDRAIRIRAEKDTWQSRKRESGKGQEYHISSLPAETRRYLAERAVSEQGLAVTDHAAGGRAMAKLLAPEVPVKPDAGRKLLTLGQGARKKVDARLLILQAADIFLAPYQACQQGEVGRRTFIEAYRTRALHLPVSVYEQQKPFSLITLRRWQGTLADEGPAALAGNYQRERPSSVVQSPDLAPFLTALVTAIPANQEARSQFQPQDVAWRGAPGFVYSGPMPALPVRANPLCQGKDLNWVRDGVQNVLQGYIESTVTISGEGVARRVLCFDQAGNLVGETMSRASDGKYRFDLLWLNRRYMLVAQDDPAFGPADYNAVAADFQQPTPYAPGEGVGLTGG